MTRHTLVLLVASLLLGGCGKPKLMPTPLIFAETGVDPIGTQAPESSASDTTTRIFYATDRTPRTDPRSPAATYTNDRDTGLRLGVASVDLAPDMSWEELHDTSLQAERKSNPTPRLTDVEEIGPIWLDIPMLNSEPEEDHAVAERFVSEVQAELDRTDLDEIFIFVHGFNTLFDDNCVLAAELHHYLGTQGVFMSYEWPSKGSMFAYSADKAAAAYSVRYFRLFLVYLAQRTNARRINIIAHSAGAPVAVGAIRELCLMHFDEGAKAVQERYRLGALALVAPDIDLGIFVNAVHDDMVGVPETMAIYFSTRDKALDLSSWIYGFARLGSPMTVLRERDLKFLHDHPDVTLIDVGGAEKHHGSWLGHSYFHEDPWVSSDVIMLMRHHVDPAARGLTTVDDNPIWIFPKDYPERSRSAAQELYGSSGN